MIRCEEFEGELTSIREDVIDSLEDGWVVKSVGKINFHHHLHLKMINHIHLLVCLGGRNSLATFRFLQQATDGCLSQRGAARLV